MWPIFLGIRRPNVHSSYQFLSVRMQLKPVHFQPGPRKVADSQYISSAVLFKFRRGLESNRPSGIKKKKKKKKNLPFRLEENFPSYFWHAALQTFRMWRNRWTFGRCRDEDVKNLCSRISHLITEVASYLSMLILELRPTLSSRCLFTYHAIVDRGSTSPLIICCLGVGAETQFSRISVIKYVTVLVQSCVFSVFRSDKPRRCELRPWFHLLTVL